jgi:hypothetical protein
LYITLLGQAIGKSPINRFHLAQFESGNSLCECESKMSPAVLTENDPTTLGKINNLWAIASLRFKLSLNR